MSAMRKPRKPLTKITDYEEMDISLDALKVCPELFQVRAGLDKDVSKRYARQRADGSKFPAVIVYLIDGEFYLIDGFHRHDAWVRLGLPTIPAVIRDGTMEDALLAALEANGDGVVDRKLNENDRIHSVELMIRNEEFRTWSDREISRRCGTGHRLIRKVRLELSELHGIPLPEKVKLFRDGIWFGQWRSYRRQSDRTVRTKRSKGQNDRFLVHIQGEEIFLGLDKEVAEARLAKIEMERNESKFALSDNSRFVEWLRGRCIYPRLMPRVLGRYFATFVGDVICLPVAELSGDGFLLAEAKLLNLRVATGHSGRLVVVGHTHVASGDITTGALLSNAPKLGIEVMTPEEFVAEFGPKDGDGSDDGLTPLGSKIVGGLTEFRDSLCNDQEEGLAHD